MSVNQVQGSNVNELVDVCDYSSDVPELAKLNFVFVSAAVFPTDPTVVGLG
jgi:hypothetical protein